jgi:hypothetical protein
MPGVRNVAAAAVVSTVAVVSLVCASAMDRPELKDVPPAIRDWFESMVSRPGNPAAPMRTGTGPNSRSEATNIGSLSKRSGRRSRLRPFLSTRPILLPKPLSGTARLSKTRSGLADTRSFASCREAAHETQSINSSAWMKSSGTITRHGYVASHVRSLLLVLARIMHHMPRF